MDQNPLNASVAPTDIQGVSKGVTKDVAKSQMVGGQSALIQSTTEKAQLGAIKEGAQIPVSQSVTNVGKSMVMSDEQIQEVEERDNRSLASQKSKLDSLQKQAPPTDQKELVQYLMKRLEAAEGSIKVCEDVIKSERDLRKGSNKQLKAQIN